MTSTFYLLLTCALLIQRAVAADIKPPGVGNRPAEWITYDVPTQFIDPVGLARPYIRYWVPDADVEDDTLYFDIEQMKEKGWDGAEIICLEQYGIELAVVDPAIYGYGGTNWYNRFNTMLHAAKTLNMTVDFALGPTQGASIPILDPDSPGMNTELAYGQVNLTAGQSYNGTLPQPIKVNAGYANTPDFVAPFQNYTNKFISAVLCRKSATLSADSRVTNLDYSSVQDVTSLVQDGSISVTAPVDGEYILFTFWQRRTGYLAAQGAFNNATNPSNPASWFAYVVDHFSQEGTDIWTNFTETYVMGGENGDLLRELAVYAWEDSAEFRATLFWTDNFIEEFEAARNYSPIHGLPAQYGTTDLPPNSMSNSYFYYTYLDDDGVDIGGKLRNDFYQTLQELYEKYHLDGLSTWSASWDLQGSLQPYATAPNLAPPWDMNSAAAHIDAPETESNYFDGVIDAFRAMGGGAMMGQKQIFSSELGAHRYESYAITWPVILNDCKINYVGGVNRIVTHGYPYTGLRPEVEWPGLTTFEWKYSEMWGPRQPAWEYTREFNDWIARTQLILQTGIPRVDIGIYRHKYLSVDIKHYGIRENIFGDASLADAGYSYVSVSPSLLTLDNAVVTDDLLADDGPGFSAFIIDNSTNITTEAVTRFTEYAEQGFPILFVGGLPEQTPYYNPDADQEVKNGVLELLNYSSVKNLSTEAEVVGALEELGVLPVVRNSPPTPIVYVHRLDKLNAVDYFWAYNSDIYEDHSTEVSIKASGIPYTLNAWTGEIFPVLNYTTEDGRYHLWVELASNQSTIFAFAPRGFFSDVAVPRSHIVETDIEYLSYSPEANTIIAKSPINSNHTIKLSDNRTVVMKASDSLPTSVALGPWNLTIQDWLPNPDPWNNYTSVFEYHDIVLDDLIPWYNISGLENTSGIGTYTTRFDWPPASNGTISTISNTNNSVIPAMITLPPTFHTVKLFVNSEWTGPIDVDRPVVDVSAYLVNGVNDVRVEVSTTMRNRLIQVNVTQSWEEAQYAETYGLQPYGLVGQVMLTALLEERIKV